MDNLTSTQHDALDRMLDQYKGNMILSRIENLLQERRFTVNPTRADREMFAQMLRNLNDGLVKYLRKDDHVTPDWDMFPIARTWFCQNHV